MDNRLEVGTDYIIPKSCLKGCELMEYVVNALMLLGGYIIAEIIRRINRAESFSEIIFEKRLYAFLELYRIF